MENLRKTRSPRRGSPSRNTEEVREGVDEKSASFFYGWMLREILPAQLRAMIYSNFSK